jgi:hypothetical protein
MSVFVVRGSKLAARKVGGEMVILSAEDSSLFVLNEVGTTIWEAADGRTSIPAIVDAMCLEYDVDRDTALRDVEEFVEALVAAGVLSTSNQAVA